MDRTSNDSQRCLKISPPGVVWHHWEVYHAQVHIPSLAPGLNPLDGICCRRLRGNRSLCWLSLSTIRAYISVPSLFSNWLFKWRLEGARDRCKVCTWAAFTPAYFINFPRPRPSSIGKTTRRTWCVVVALPL